MANTTSYQSLVKKLLRIIKILAITLAILTITVFTLFYIKKDKIAADLVVYFNSIQNGEIKIDDIALSPFKHFPEISLRLDGLNYYESDSLHNQTPFASIDHVYVTIDILKLLEGEIDISEVTLEGGFVFLQIDSDYKLNLLRAFGITSANSDTDSLSSFSVVVTPPDNQQQVSLDLQNIHIQNVAFKLESKPAEFEINLRIKKLHSEIQYNQPITEIQASIDFELHNLGINNYNFLNNRHFSLQTYFSYDENIDQIRVKNGMLHYRDLTFGLNGTYNIYEDGWIDLYVDGSDNDMTLLSLVIEDNILEFNPDILDKGNLYFSGKIAGETIRGFPSITFSFGAKNIQVKLPDGAGQIDDFGFNGYFNSGTNPDLSEAVLKIDTINATLSDSHFNGNFILQNFVTLSLILNIDSKINLELLDRIFKIQEFDSLDGILSVKSSINTNFEDGNITRQYYSGNIDLKFEDMDFNYPDKDIRVRNLTGELSNIDSVTKLTDFTILLNDNHINFDGTITNMVYGFLKNIGFDADLHITSDTLNISSVLVKDSINKNVFINNPFTDIKSNIHIHVPYGFANNNVLSVALTISELNAKHKYLPDIELLTGTINFNEDSLINEITVADFNIKTSEGSVEIDGKIQRIDSVYRINAMVSAENVKPNNLSNILTGTEGVDSALSFHNDLDAAFILNSELNLNSIITGSLMLDSVNVTYIDTEIDTISLENLQLHLKNIVYHPMDSFSLSGFQSFTGEIKMDSINTRYFNETNTHISLDKQDLLLDLSFNTTGFRYGNTDEASIRIDARGSTPVYKLNYQLTNIRIDSLLKQYYEEDIMSGEFSFTISIVSFGSTMDSIARNANGTILLTGHDLVIYGIDLDDFLANYKKSQNFRLTDVGAFLMLGPFGPVLSKGFDFAKITKISPEDSTIIRQFYSKWTLNDKVVSSEDVAFSTDKSRIAFNGSVNLRDETIPGLTVSVIDKRGCSLMDQTISGSFENPELGDLNVIGTLFGAVINVFKLAAGNKCKPVYTGSVQHPGKSK